MKKVLIALALIVLVAGVALYMFQTPLKDAAYDTITENMFVPADTDDFDPGPAVGSRFPGLQASYQGRVITLLDEFAGDRGTVLVASRSFDWCPYCMRQLVQLQETKEAYDAAGIGLVAITYDAPELQLAFTEKHGITIPVLSDLNALSFKTLGILNEDYSQGDSQYGIPHPGMIVIAPDGTVVGKLFIEAYSSRVDSGAALLVAQEALRAHASSN
ncbi:MAG: redoxin domain-containing protein [Halieaceae bacterium]|nr:redoxin domain-containing protein [Halieaceae bacterium]